MPTFDERYKRLRELEAKAAEIERKHSKAFNESGSGQIVRAGQVTPELRAYFAEMKPVQDEIKSLQGSDTAFMKYYRERLKREMKSSITALKKDGRE